MRIKEMFNQYRNDFSAIMVCEWCGATKTITTGYNDTYYHQNVIPAMRCSACGKNRAGEVEK